jgi:hypothetical protein
MAVKEPPGPVEMRKFFHNFPGNSSLFRLKKTGIKLGLIKKTQL